MQLLGNKAVRIVTLALIAHAAVLFAISRPEPDLDLRPLSAFPRMAAQWTQLQEGYVDEETRQVLKADDVMTRTYGRNSDSYPLNLFMAVFKSQRTGKSPHSPKNCLPGAGWLKVSDGTLNIDLPGRGPVVVNRYIVSKGDSRSVVVYWYQSHNRIVASEYSAKVYTVLDSIRFNRTDTALVRVVAPVVKREDEQATKIAVSFIQDMYPAIEAALPQ